MVFSRAEVALRRAKRGGRNRTMLESSSVRSLAAELADAIAADAVRVLYQPIVSLDDDNVIVGVRRSHVGLRRPAPTSPSPR